MISRIGFICYTQNVPLSKMADRITMITFTNEAADNMEEKLKDEEFLGDTKNLLRQEENYDPLQSYGIVRSKLIDKLME